MTARILTTTSCMRDYVRTARSFEQSESAIATITQVDIGYETPHRGGCLTVYLDDYGIQA